MRNPLKIIPSLLFFICLCHFFGSCKAETRTPENAADSAKIVSHLIAITKTDKARNYQNVATLDSVAAYIYSHFDRYADTTYYQKFEAKGNEYKNVICVLGAENKETIVIGAHYDVYGEYEGADDNASGVVGLLELARMLNGQELKYRIEMVAFTLEEPPFFRTEKMGSYVHAKSLHENEVPVYGMLCLEMIGYFDNSDHSQDYPVSVLSPIYGHTGDYITLVSKWGKGDFASSFSDRFKDHATIKTKKFSGPKAIQGVDFSDHLNYWKFDFSALMITDTAFYRNKNYHTSGDTLSTLNIRKMAKVIDSVYLAILSLS